METTNQTLVVAIFPNRGAAEKAMDSLRHAEIEEKYIHVAGPGEPLHEDTSATAKLEKQSEKGAVRGAVVGGAAGALAGAVATGIIPGIGPILAGGILAGILGGAATGAAVGTYAGPFVALGASETDAKQWEGELKAGRTMVMVQAGEKIEQGLLILQRHGGEFVRTIINPKV
jgi:hypothetical protein